MLKKVLLAGAAAMAITGVAHAVPVTQGGSFTVDYALPGVGGGPTLTATTVYSNFNFVTPTQLTFNLSVTNTTLSGYTSARFTSFGWDTAPVASSATDNSAIYSSTTNASISGNQVDVCIYGGPNCNGGGNGGLNLGESTSFTETLTFSTVVPPLDFSGFYAKFQTNAGSVEGGGTVRPPTPPVGVPEPMSLALLGTGLLGLGMTRRRA